MKNYPPDPGGKLSEFVYWEGNQNQSHHVISSSDSTVKLFLVTITSDTVTNLVFLPWANRSLLPLGYTHSQEQSSVWARFILHNSLYKNCNIIKLLWGPDAFSLLYCHLVWWSHQKSLNMLKMPDINWLFGPKQKILQFSVMYLWGYDELRGKKLLKKMQIKFLLIQPHVSSGLKAYKQYDLCTSRPSRNVLAFEYPALIKLWCYKYY